MMVEESSNCERLVGWIFLRALRRDANRRSSSSNSSNNSETGTPVSDRLCLALGGSSLTVISYADSNTVDVSNNGGSRAGASVTFDTLHRGNLVP